MNSKEYEKTVLFFDLYRYAVFRGVSNGKKQNRFKCSFTASEIINFWKKHLGTADAGKKYLGGRMEVYLADIKEDENFFYLLLNCTNATGAHHSSRDIDSGQTRGLQYLSNEGPNNSSHIIIRKKSFDDRNLIVVERAANLTTSRLVSFLNHLCDKLLSYKEVDDKFLAKHPLGELNGKGEVKLVKKYSRLELHGYISESFFEDLGNGYVDDIVLLSDMKKIAGMDIDPPTEFKTWQISVDKKPLKNCTARDYLREITNSAHEFDMEKVRIKFRDPSGASHTKKLSLQNLGIDDNEAYTLTRRISLSFRPSLAYSTVNRTISQKIVELIGYERL